MLNRSIRSPYTNVYMNLALEQALARQLQQDERILLFWINDPAVVFGRFQNPWSECRTELLTENGVIPARRYSGGGTVFHDSGNLNYSVISNRQALDIPGNLGILSEALKQQGIQARIGPRRDLLTEDRKISGSAFQLHRDFAIHHGTLLIDADLDRIRSLLGTGLSITENRSVASVPSPVTNIGRAAGLTDPEDWITLIREAFGKAWGSFSKTPEALPDPERLAQDSARLAQWEWIFGQTPPFVLNLSGGRPVSLRIDQGRIVSVLQRDGPDSGQNLPTDIALTAARLAEMAAYLNIHTDITPNTLIQELRSKEDYHVI